MGEQTVLASLVYEDDLPFFSIPIIQHCYVWEKFIKHKGKGIPYVDTTPMLNDQPVVFRHFCGTPNKDVLAKLIPALKKQFGLR